MATTRTDEIPDIVTTRVWPERSPGLGAKRATPGMVGARVGVASAPPEVAAKIAAGAAAGDYDRVPILFGQDAGLIATIEPAPRWWRASSRGACRHGRPASPPDNPGMSRAARFLPCAIPTSYRKGQ
jgi:hypothetical protein